MGICTLLSIIGHSPYFACARSAGKLKERGKNLEKGEITLVKDGGIAKELGEEISLHVVSYKPSLMAM